MPPLEQRFWSYVWQCPHRHPCRRCCWPWRPALTTAWVNGLLPSYGQLPSALLPWKGMAHRWACILTTHALFLPFGRDTAVCHRCDFCPCCNPAHLVFGTQRDNMTTMARRGFFYATHAPVRLPDGSCYRFDVGIESIAHLFAP